MAAQCLFLGTAEQGPAEAFISSPSGLYQFPTNTAKNILQTIGLGRHILQSPEPPERVFILDTRHAAGIRR